MRATDAGERRSPVPWAGRVVLAPGLVLYVGPGSIADRHEHHAVQLVWSNDGAIDLRLDSRAFAVSAALVPARVAHEIRSSGRRVALVLVDAHGARGTDLDRRAHELVGEDVSAPLGDVGFPPDELSRADAEDWCRRALAALGVESSDTRAPSRPTRIAIRYIEETLDGVPRITEAAGRASTSPTRLSHRFSREIGLPFRRFVLWTRIKRAAEVVQAGGDLSRAAATAGFSDAAHLSRTFRRTFGLSPSLVLPFLEWTGSPWAKNLSALRAWLFRRWIRHVLNRNVEEIRAGRPPLEAARGSALVGTDRVALALSSDAPRCGA